MNYRVTAINVVSAEGMFSFYAQPQSREYTQTSYENVPEGKLLWLEINAQRGSYRLVSLTLSFGEQ